MKVLDKNPDNLPPAVDHNSADNKVGDTIWTSLQNKYLKDPLWKDLKTAPIIMRFPHKAKKNQ